MSQTEHFLNMWNEARTRLSIQLINLSEDDLTKRIEESGNSIGFLLRHIGDVELLFAKNIFGNKLP